MRGLLSKPICTKEERDFFTAVPSSYHHSDQDSPDNMLTTVPEVKISMVLLIPVQSSNTKGMQSRRISLSSNYIRSGFLSDLLWCEFSDHRGHVWCTSYDA